jgi:glycosyltransferase involved in cell wall biosynthesis
MKKLAIITTHPIQYYAPVFKLLQQRGKINIKVFYTWGDDTPNRHDPGFNRSIAWDVPLLDGYAYQWIKNTADNPGSHHYKGIVNPGLIEDINNFGPNALLIIGWAYDSHLKAIRYFSKKLPVYFRGDSHLLDERSGFKSILKTIFLMWVYKHISHAFYVGVNNKAYYKKYGLSDAQLTFAPHAVDNKRFAAPRTAEADELRKTLGIPDSAVLILFAAKYEAKKSPLLLLNAFIALNDLNTHILFIGNGELESALKQHAATHQRIHFMDFVNQAYMPIVYQAANIFCLPSGGPNESWGLAVNEAMACGKAIIVSDKCGCAANLVTEQNGIIFSSGNIAELTLGLKKITSNKALLNSMGQQSVSLIDDWDFDHIASAVENKLLSENK